MKRFAIGILAVTAVLMSSMANADELKVGGGGASVATVFAPLKAPFEKATGTTLINIPTTPKNGLVELWNGKVDVATGAVPLDGAIAGAQKDGTAIDKGALSIFEVANNNTVLLVHKDNPVGKLSKVQAKGIFTGKITNWKDVGGPDKEIIVVWGKNTPGQNAQFTKGILDGEAIVKDFLETTDYAGVKTTVGTTPEGIGIDPAAFADASVKIIPTDPALTSPIYLVTKGKPSAAVQKLLDFIKGEGQQYIKK
jgi:phosphate transport system substrate-binding protein